MERTLMADLIKWKDNPLKKPLILQGVRQCGKTYLVKEFGGQFYNDVLYLKFDYDKGVADFFEADLNPRRIIKDLSLARSKDIKPHQTLIIFDEIQSCEKALTSLKYFCEEAPEYHIIAAGSLLGVAIPKGTSFPVGKVEFLTLYPMNFFEFLLANNSMLAKELKEASLNDGIWERFRSILGTAYRDFQIIGGMPEVVQRWLDTNSIEEVEKIQAQIISSYENDFAKYAQISYFPKLSAIWNAIPSQLAKENRKFIFSQVKKSWRAKDLEDALEWLIRAGLVYKIENIEKPSFPIKAYANHSCFKLYLSDIGLLRKMANLPPIILFDKSDNYKEFKGAMAENFICCELKKIYDDEIYYWTAEGSGRSEIDFIIQDGKYIIPIEVKAGSARRARSLARYIEKYKPEKAVLTSLDEMSKKNLPLYAFWAFKKWICEENVNE
ncbi:MAG: AAA family ATPase [Lachnospiraceae bacterium]|nr:AAA family ATPase [Lachnospiraceae bacterium]